MRTYQQLKSILGMKKEDRPLLPETRFTVQFDDFEVSCGFDGGKVKKLAWKQITGILIQTTSDGPFRPDVWWHLMGNSKGLNLCFPMDAIGENCLVVELKARYPDMKIQGMNCTEDKTFLVWGQEPR